ncbi:uncharacterized protein K452DRAFT_292205 [Aplosporella prunicola CBS 121167]|uniref:Heterokaryon incompatibility domain-containing protein n=1 Tax=Aplosporella prunicola CBS 121167 TaxID=1176127 RepID=A0A6A6AZT7_9PEZI|nr:uncharacterized protein K452DRAFT_292205 [Aplosporella prunicola CBS 121167]KAF2136693.1 hypothetical protein K452DRAFT_292205 [Aplosporella prunicola CBS 121167]
MNYPLECRLRTYAIDRAPPYEAISYVWRVFDDNRDISYIFCNGRLLKITWNLDEALFHSTGRKSTKYLWADAICINQRDKNERARQVRSMGAIFAQASRVLAWLGGKAGEAFEVVRLLRKAVHLSGQTDRPVLIKMVKEVPEPSWIDFHEVVYKEWFSRIWILQEIGLASDALLLCEDDAIQ